MEGIKQVDLSVNLETADTDIRALLKHVKPEWAEAEINVEVCHILTLLPQTM